MGWRAPNRSQVWTRGLAGVAWLCYALWLIGSVAADSVKYQGASMGIPEWRVEQVEWVARNVMILCFSLGSGAAMLAMFRGPFRYAVFCLFPLAVLMVPLVRNAFEVTVWLFTR